MNKAIWIFFGLLVVATGALSWHFLSPRVAETPAPEPAKHQPPPSLLGTASKKSSAPAPGEQRPADPAPVRKLNDIPGMQKMRQKLADSTNRTTPQMRQRMLDSIMRSREPRYRQLFESWNLDPASADDALRVLRDRETSQSDLRTKYMGDPSSDLLELSSKSKAASADAEAKLLAIVGQDRLMELVQEEERMKAESSAKAKELIDRMRH